jgi:hypothetical protein
MSLHRNTSLRHLSYEELDSLLRRLADSVLNKGNCTGLQCVSKDDMVLTALLSEFTGIPIEYNSKSWKVGLVSEIDTDICVFRKNYNSNHYNRTVKCYVEDLFQEEEDDSFTKITLPWRK